jgi:hypothetical protein
VAPAHPHDDGPHDDGPHDDAADVGGAPDHDEDARSTGTAAVPHRAGAAVAAVPAGQTQPPRRRGVFVDVDELRAHVGDLLRAMLGGYQVDAFGNMTFEHQGAHVYVTVGPGNLGPQVGVFSITNVELDLTPALARFLLTSNHRLAFGAFSYDEENEAVWLRHSLLGATLDGPELRGAVLSIAQLAARVDDAIADRFGGRKFVDAPAEDQARTRPPEVEEDEGDATNASGYL